jgi:hypothetical protein
MHPSRIPTSAALLLLLALASPVSAQRGGQGTGSSVATPTRTFGNLDLLVSVPTGAFRENVGTGGGVGLGVRHAMDTAGIFSLRGDFGFLLYGSETIRICVTNPCRVTGDLTTSNTIGFGSFGPEVAVDGGGVRFYANGSVGFTWFATTSEVEGANNQGQPFASDTNFEDVTLSWLGGWGVQFPLSRGANPLLLDLGARYHANGEAEYLRPGDIQDRPDGSIVLSPRRSDTDFWTFRIGLVLGLTPGMGERERGW